MRSEVWRPRLEALAQKFGDRVKVEPRIAGSSRDATFQFQSSVARISLKFSAYASDDVQKIVVAYDGEEEIRAPFDRCVLIMPKRELIKGREMVTLSRPC